MDGDAVTAAWAAALAAAPWDGYTRPAFAAAGRRAVCEVLADHNAG